MIAAVNGMQCFGELFAAIVSLATTAAFRSAYEVSSEGECGAECRMAADRAWRTVVAVGAFPAIIALYYRITIPETPRYTFDVEHDLIKADADFEAFVTRKKTGDLDAVQQARIRESAKHGLNIPKASWADVKSYFGKPRNWKLFVGVTLSHFFIVSRKRSVHRDTARPADALTRPGLCRLRPQPQQRHRPPGHRVRAR
jgi:PHS family inorganic phosphate transporter-like MFS transporter